MVQHLWYITSLSSEGMPIIISDHLSVLFGEVNPASKFFTCTFTLLAELHRAAPIIFVTMVGTAFLCFRDKPAHALFGRSVEDASISYGEPSHITQYLL